MNIAVYMCQVLPTYTIATFTPIIVDTFGFTTIKAQLMVAPPSCVAIVMVFVVSYLSDCFKSCSGILVVNSIMACTGDLMLALVPAKHSNVRYGATFLTISGILSGVTLSVGNITGNCCGGDVKKAIAAGLFQAFGSTMGVATGYLFPQDQGPAYEIGFWVLPSTTAFTGCGSAFMTYMTISENRRRDEL